MNGMSTGRNVAERVIWTFIQAAIAAVPVLQVTSAIQNRDFTALQTMLLTGAGAGVAALVSLAKNLTTGAGPTNVLERMAWTFVQGGLGSIVVADLGAAVSHTSLAALEQVALAALGGGVAAVLSVAKNTTLGTPAKHVVAQ